MFIVIEILILLNRRICYNIEYFIYKLLNYSQPIYKAFMKLSQLSKFNLQFQEIQQRQKGLFTFYHEQMNESQLEENICASSESQSYKNEIQHKLKNKYQRKSQKKPSRHEITKSNHQPKMQKIKVKNQKIQPKEKKKLFNSKSLHKASSSKLNLKQFEVNFHRRDQNSRTTMSIFNFDQKQYFKGELNQAISISDKQKQNVRFMKKQVQIKNSQQPSKSGCGNLSKGLLVNRLNQKASANYLFPIFDQKKQSFKIREIKNKSKIQSKRVSNNTTKINNVHNLSVHVSSSQEYYILNSKKQIKESLNFNQIPNLRKRQETLTYRLRQYLKNQKTNAIKKKQKEAQQLRNFQQHLNQYIKPYKYQQKLQQILIEKIKNQKMRS